MGIQPDMFEQDFCLGVGKFRVTGKPGQKVQLSYVEKGTIKLFEVTPDQALVIAEAITTIATCTKYAT